MSAPVCIDDNFAMPDACGNCLQRDGTLPRRRLVSNVRVAVLSRSKWCDMHFALVFNTTFQEVLYSGTPTHLAYPLGSNLGECEVRPFPVLQQRGSCYDLTSSVDQDACYFELRFDLPYTKWKSCSIIQLLVDLVPSVYPTRLSQ